MHFKVLNVCYQGIHLDPSIYLMDDENKLPADDQAKSKEAKSLPVTSDGYTATQMENNPSSICNSHDENSNSSLGQANSEEFYVDQLPKISASLESMHLAGKVTECKTHVSFHLCLHFLYPLCRFKIILPFKGSWKEVLHDIWLHILSF